jgi:hypothetical protein
MPRHVVRSGECIESIATGHGFFWETIWNLPDNEALRTAREEPTILRPGDEVVIPDKRRKDESGATEQRHRFRRKGVPVVLRLRILRPSEEERSEAEAEAPDPEQLRVEYIDPEPVAVPPDEPWRSAPYRLTVDHQVFEGSTDGDGRLEQAIPSGARRGELRMEPGTEREAVYTLDLGGLDPIDTPSGLADRLNNLGYGGGERPTALTAQLREALRAFQQDQELRVTGDADDETKAKLQELHGS